MTTPTAQGAKTSFVPPVEMQLLSVKEVAALLGVHRTTIKSLRKNRGFPAPVRIGSHRVRWQLAAVQAWIDRGGAPPASGCLESQ